MRDNKRVIAVFFMGIALCISVLSLSFVPLLAQNPLGVTIGVPMYDDIHYEYADQAAQPINITAGSDAITIKSVAIEKAEGQSDWFDASLYFGDLGVAVSGDSGNHYTFTPKTGLPSGDYFALVTVRYTRQGQNVEHVARARISFIVQNKVIPAVHLILPEPKVGEPLIWNVIDETYRGTIEWKVGGQNLHTAAFQQSSAYTVEVDLDSVANHEFATKPLVEINGSSQGLTYSLTGQINMVIRKYFNMTGALEPTVTVDYHKEAIATHPTRYIEYSLDNGSTWSDFPTSKTDIELPSVASITYLFREKAHGNYPVGLQKSQTISMRRAAPSATDFTIEYEGEKITTTLTEPLQYKVDQGEWKTFVPNMMPHEWDGSALDIDICYAPVASRELFRSEAVKLTLPARRTLGDITLVDNEMTVADVQVDETIQYRAFGTAAWTDAATGNANVTLPSPGCYEVRLKASATSFASGSSICIYERDVADQMAFHAVERTIEYGQLLQSPELGIGVYVGNYGNNEVSYQIPPSVQKIIPSGESRIDRDLKLTAAPGVGLHELSLKPKFGSGLSSLTEVTVYLTVVPYPLTDDEIQVRGAVSSYAYTGQEVKPQPEIYVNNVKLTRDTDYSITYSNNVDFGEASMTITMKKNYIGSRTILFSIVKNDMAGLISFSSVVPKTGLRQEKVNLQDAMYNVKTEWNGIEPDGSGIFAPESVYTLKVTLDAVNSSTHRFIANMAAVNGVKASIGQVSDGLLVIEYTFPRTAPLPPEIVSMDQANRMLTFKPTPKYLQYSLNGGSWQDLGGFEFDRVSYTSYSQWLGSSVSFRYRPSLLTSASDAVQQRIPSINVTPIVPPNTPSSGTSSGNQAVSSPTIPVERIPIPYRLVNESRAVLSFSDALMTRITSQKLDVAVIDLSTLKKVHSLQVSTSLFKHFVNKNTDICVAFANGSNIRFDASAMKEVMTRSSATTMVIQLEKRNAEKLPDAMRAVADDLDVYELSIIIGGKSIEALEDSSFSLILPLANLPSETVSALIVELMQDGNLREHASVSDMDNATINIDCQNMGYYAVQYQEIEETPQKTESEPQPSEPVIEPEEPRWQNPFVDVEETDWFYADVAYVHQNGLFSGMTADTFEPDIAMTRGMLVTVLSRLATADLSGYRQSSFKDVAPDRYYAEAIEWAREMGIVSGVSADQFEPDRAVTRQELMTILYNYVIAMGLELPEAQEKEPFSDQDEIADWALIPVLAMQKAGLVGGRAGNRFEALATATRAEVAAMMQRFAQQLYS